MNTFNTINLYSKLPHSLIIQIKEYYGEISILSEIKNFNKKDLKFFNLVNWSKIKHTHNSIKFVLDNNPKSQTVDVFGFLNCFQSPLNIHNFVSNNNNTNTQSFDEYNIECYSKSFVIETPFI